MKLFWPILLLISSLITAQDTAVYSNVFSYEEYINWVAKHHPVMAQSQIITDQADAVLTEARGNFDPELGGNFRQKDFEDKTYYRIGQGGLYVPAWFGADVNINYKYAEGGQLNPENYVPQPGIMEFGISVPLSPSLWMDKRRAALRNAKLFVESSVWMQKDFTNQLYLASSLDYWDWALQYERVKMLNEGLTIAERQYNLVRNSVLAGDRPTIDSIEANLLLQQVQINLAEAQMQLQNARLQLSVHLWVDGYIPLELNDSLQPEPITALITYWDLPSDTGFLEMHPMVNMLQLDGERYRVDLQLYKASLFPQVKLSYQMLAGLEPFETDFATGSNGLQNNHYLGVGVSMPIFWATERANLKQAQLKIRDTELKIALKRAELGVKYEQLGNEANTYTNQINLLSSNIEGFRILVEAEETLFAVGESSLFMVNTRINRLLDAQLKFAELNFKRKKAFVYWYVISGQGF